MLKGNNSNHIKDGIEQILNDDTYKENANTISKSIRTAGGAKKEADVILIVIDSGEIHA